MGTKRKGESQPAYVKRHAQEQKAWCKRHPGRNAGISKKHRTAHPERNLLNLAKHRAKTDGLAFEISEEDIFIPEVCPLLGIKLIVGGVDKDATPSLDRIIPTKGYVRDNVWVISFRANRLKSDSTPEELTRLTVALKQRWPDKDGDKDGSQS